MLDDDDPRRDELLRRARRCVGRKTHPPKIDSIDDAHALILNAISVVCEDRDRLNHRPLGTSEAFVTVHFRPELPSMTFVQAMGVLKAVSEDDPVSTWAEGGEG